MNMKKILSAFLAVLFVIGAGAQLGTFKAEAAYADKVDENGNPIINYYTQTYNTQEAKLRDMTLYKEIDGYQIYVEEFTGEIAFVDKKSGNAIFSNPYDVATNAQSNTTKQTLLSQITLNYQDNGVQKDMNSYVDAALRGQIKTKNIKNGIRMEYTIGEIQVTRLVPRRISKERFETLIADKVTSDFHKQRLLSFYQLYDTSDTDLTETLVKEMEAAFPITKRMAIYVCSTEITSAELKQLESIIKTYCPLYTYDEMDQDHNETDYVGVEVAPPCFRMALEYTVKDGCLDVRLPANGIRFDESVYTLGTISVLPYMGCGNVTSDGYAFIPDGSGAIVRYSDVKGSNSTISGQMYGADFAYHTVTGQHEQTMRYPVFGNVVNMNYEYTESTTNKYNSPQTESAGETVQVTRNQGYLAIITEGDSMAQIIEEHNGQLNNYLTVYAKFTPRPSDTYNLADSISIGANASWTVVSKRKYSGSYRIRYILLSDTERADGKTYECSYVGMAKAYRDYLIDNGIIEQLDASEVKDDVPLYIETFGSIETADRFLSFPITVDTPLTSFDDIESMYDELSENGISNVNFKLTGYTNGGLDATYPSKISFVSALGGKSGFKGLLESAKDKGFGVFPDFDFAYVAKTAYFDGISPKRDAVKTIDSRYTSRKTYNSATQSLEDDFAKAISPSRYEYFADKFIAAYDDYENQSLSVSTLGTALNSDFDKKDPYNRVDSQNFTTEMLASLKEAFSDIMLDGGNIYSIPYASHVLGVSTDSSNYMKASESVPFAGIILHGFVNFTGAALNMEGDVAYSMLKSIENGAYLYYTLSYENTNELKESETYNKYYSVDYANWKDEVIKQYAIVNEALSDLQTTLIDDHKFVSAYRVPSEADLEADRAEAAAKTAEAEKALEALIAKEELDAKLAERKGVAAPTPAKRPNTNFTVTTKTTEEGTVYSPVEKYETTLGTVVNVVYENGTSFFINYNTYDVVVNFNGADHVIGALDFVKLD